MAIESAKSGKPRQASDGRDEVDQMPNDASEMVTPISTPASTSLG